VVLSAKKAGVKGLVLVTLADISKGARKQISELYRSEKIIPIVLERSDLLNIRDSRDLVMQIRMKASALLQAEGFGV
jgi:hypothetical protein